MSSGSKSANCRTMGTSPLAVLMKLSGVSDLTVKHPAHHDLELSIQVFAFPIVHSVYRLELADHTGFDERVEGTECG